MFWINGAPAGCHRVWQQHRSWQQPWEKWKWARRQLPLLIWSDIFFLVIFKKNQARQLLLFGWKNSTTFFSSENFWVWTEGGNSTHNYHTVGLGKAAPGVVCKLTVGRILKLGSLCCFARMMWTRAVFLQMDMDWTLETKYEYFQHRDMELNSVKLGALSVSLDLCVLPRRELVTGFSHVVRGSWTCGCLSGSPEESRWRVSPLHCGSTLRQPLPNQRGLIIHTNNSSEPVARVWAYTNILLYHNLFATLN